MKFDNIIGNLADILLQNPLYQRVLRIIDYKINEAMVTVKEYTVNETPKSIPVSGHTVILNDKIGNYLLVDTTGQMSFEENSYTSEQPSYDIAIGTRIWSIVRDGLNKYDSVDILQDLVFSTSLIPKNTSSISKIEVIDAMPNKYDTVGDLFQYTGLDTAKIIQNIKNWHICLLSCAIHFKNVGDDCKFICEC